VSDAYYLPLGGDRFRSTEHTSGPWDPALQHAGPPSALMARAIESEPAAWSGVLTRMTVEILGPIPVAELSLRTTVLRTGRSVELVQAELAAGDKVAARASGWRIRRTDLDLPPLPPEHDDPARDAVPPFPTEAAPFPVGLSGGYVESMEWRDAHDTWSQLGPSTVWGRMRYPLVPDEEPSGLQRVLTIADSGNGVSFVLPPQQWFFINTELTVHLAAEPAGEWICLDAHTRVDRAGFGLAASRLFDRERLVARGAQSLYVGHR
jgi:hypothetical protein